MDKDRFPLTASREPNPLRPYYIPPSIGPTSATSPPQAAHTPRPAPTSSLSSSARDYLPDIDIDLRSTTGEAWTHTRALLDTLVWRYTSILLAQPFDVAKTVLQLSLPPSAASLSTPVKSRKSAGRTSAGRHSHGASRASHLGSESDSEGSSERSDDDMPDYFTSAAPRSRSPRRRKRAPHHSDNSPSRTPTPKDRREQDSYADYKLRLTKPDSITHAISTIYTTSGAVGLWRATNCTFVYSVLLRTADSFIRGLLLALVGLPDIAGPDPGGLGPSLSVTGAGFSGLDVSESPNPIGSLIVAGMASCITGLLLAPLDLVRTRLIASPISHAPRGLVQNLRQLPSLVVPSVLWLPTALYYSVPQIFSAASPLILRRQLRITPELTPSLWSVAAFTTSLTDLFIRLPLETLVRRAQLSVLRRHDPDLPTVFEPAEYKGVGGTIYSILYAEGETTTKDSKGMLRTRRGQGMAGLVRGWRVGFWGLVGVWGGGALGPGESHKQRGEF
ncbi:hypothetical protein BDY17DRAFT_297571 [Neohortaea acidophila]|uniref:Mitochondrial carrier domain-containing protein n=1 Tax=Neohortaea acidophila TaxID=245834 RepID=A0A6A6PUZ8_9PEZI|nr:uncharacterized protein BDY17DRAFT_297571 [Neohortaea acidophila]KAF2483541.1 hypothetical protein BDY17DRAFT_297571 [Neohortaea acidophila]